MSGTGYAIIGAVVMAGTIGVGVICTLIVVIWRRQRVVLDRLELILVAIEADTRATRKHEEARP